MRKTAPADRRPAAPMAYSWLRFSGVRQERGDSIRRQTELRDDWLKRHPDLPLDTSLTLRGLGVSAFRGKQRNDKDGLGAFLKACDDGRVPRGSYLIIENLDRLSREDERTALRLWMDILDRGVNVVQLAPETVFRHEASDMLDIMRALIELSRGRSESVMKSKRSRASWDGARQKARRGERLRRRDGRETAAMTANLPGWIEDVGGRLQLIPERAVVLRRIFEMATAGYGMSSIVKRLTTEGVPAFGDRVEVEGDGGARRYRRGDGKHFGCGEWRTSYVRSILRDRRAVGDHQPRRRDGKKDGDPIPGYYPAAVTEEEFHAARGAVEKRMRKPGRIGAGVTSLFGGLLKNARDGEVYYVMSRSDNGNASRVLVNKSAIEGRSDYWTFPYSTFEKAILRRLHEINPDEVLGGRKTDDAHQADVLRGELAHNREQQLALLDDNIKDIPAVAAKLRSLHARAVELEGLLEAAEDRAARPLADRWKEVKSLAQALDAAEDKVDARLRLRAAIRAVVDEVWVLVSRRGRARMASVQMHFTDGGRRTYRIIHRSPHGNGSKSRPGEWAVDSVKYDDPAGKIDIRNREDMEMELWQMSQEGWGPEAAMFDREVIPVGLTAKAGEAPEPPAAG
jgi:DNA invertase Pin-like site-specific DNA recombinase